MNTPGSPHRNLDQLACKSFDLSPRSMYPRRSQVGIAKLLTEGPIPMPRRLRIENLERRRCMTTWGFAEHAIDMRPSTEDAQVADLNSDGRDDLVVSLSSGIGIRLAKTNEYGFQEVRPVTIEGQAVHVADIDGDGDLDIVGSGQNLFWLENQNGASQFVRHELTESLPMENPSPHHFQSGDVNGDGKLDWVYLANSQQLVTVLNATDPTIVVTNVNVTTTQVRQIQLIDATGDSAEEVMLGDADPWYRWSGENLVPFAIPSGLGRPNVNLRRIFVDLDQDGFMDVIERDPSKVTLYELQPDRSRFEKRQETVQIMQGFTGGIEIGDYNGDGRTDLFLEIITGGGGEGLDFRVMTQSPLGHFELSERLFGHPSPNHGDWQLADIGGTGRDEFLFFHADGGISSGSAAGTNLVRGWHEPRWIGSGDLDRDGDLDLVTSADYDSAYTFEKQSLLWYENLDGQGTFGSPNPLVQDRAVSVFGITANWNEIVDWDHDGLLDIVCLWGAELFWYKNLGTAQRFAEPQTLATKLGEARDFEIADLDEDGLLELLVHVDRPATLVKLEQLPGGATVGPAEPIASSIQPFERLQVADLNDDGKPDIVAINRTGLNDGVFWMRNQGDGTMDTPISITSTGILSYDLADYDHDGDLDLFAIERSTPEQFRIYLNSGIGVFAISQPGPAKTGSLASSIQLGDLDSDGDPDVITVSEEGVYCFANEAGEFGQPVMHWTTSSTPTVHLADVNGDGHLDWVSGATHTEAGLRWHEKRLIGDANGDGIFNSSDLIALFVVNQFEDTIVGNSTFQTGDFNGDGEFNTTDLILAFQEGAYTS